nr:hypothetical protein [Tanacetum cinerariifolium]
QAAKAQSWKLPVCYDDDDDEESSNSLEDNIIFELPPYSAVTPSEPVDSLSMGDEHLNTIPAMESDEFIKSCVENLSPNPSESEGENECDVPAGFITFSYVLFDVDYDFDSGDDQIPPNHDSSIIISSKIDSLFDEFAGELTLLKSIPPGIDETDCHPEKETCFAKRLLYDNSSPRPPDSRMEVIDLPFTSDDPMSPGIEDDDYDSGRDIPILEELLVYSLPMSHTILIFVHLIVLLQNHQMEKSPDLLSHQGLEAFQPSAECLMIINGKNIPLLDVPLFHFYPP